MIEQLDKAIMLALALTLAVAMEMLTLSEALRGNDPMTYRECIRGKPGISCELALISVPKPSDIEIARAKIKYAFIR